MSASVTEQHRVTVALRAERAPQMWSLRRRHDDDAAPAEAVS